MGDGGRVKEKGDGMAGEGRTSRVRAETGSQMFTFGTE